MRCSSQDCSIAVDYGACRLMTWTRPVSIFSPPPPPPPPLFSPLVLMPGLFHGPHPLRASFGEREIPPSGRFPDVSPYSLAT